MFDASTRQSKTRDARRRVRTYGVIDLGTHNCRMLIAETEGSRQLRIIDAMSRPVRLGEGLVSTGRLSDAAMDRAMDVLKACAAQMNARGVTRVRAIATEACRRARNGADFVARVRVETGLLVQLITADEEAALTLRGCAALLKPQRDRALLIDIGGGSTEVMWVACDRCGSPRPLDLISLPFGVVDFAERFGCEHISPQTFQSMIDEVDRALDAFASASDISVAVDAQRVQMLGTSGTLTTLAAVHLGLTQYDHSRVDGTTISFTDIRALSRRLIGLDGRSRAAVPCIGAERADLVVAGCAILEAICRRWDVGRLIVADRGIREGMLLDLVASEQGSAPAGGVALAREPM